MRLWKIPSLNFANLLKFGKLFEFPSSSSKFHHFKSQKSTRNSIFSTLIQIRPIFRALERTICRLHKIFPTTELSATELIDNKGKTVGKFLSRHTNTHFRIILSIFPMGEFSRTFFFWLS